MKWMIVFGSLLLASVAQAGDTVQELNEAHTLGGPTINSWNVNTAYSLPRQVERIKNGQHWAVTIWVPLLQQGANNPARWDRWLSEPMVKVNGVDTPTFGNRDALLWLQANPQPITLRYHNQWNDLVENDPAKRGEFVDSPLIWSLRADGSLNNDPVLDPFGPIERWSELGVQIGSTLWVKNLCVYLGNAPKVYWLENNEASVGELGRYTDPIPSMRDTWGKPLRRWKDAMERISLRAADIKNSGVDANDLEVMINRALIARSQAMNQGIKDSVPDDWKCKVYIGGYGGLTNLLTDDYYSARPQEDHALHPFAASLHQFDEPSERCYDDGSGGPANWHDYVRSPFNLQNNAQLVTQYLSSRPLWHDDLSFWFNWERMAKAVPDHGGLVTPGKMTGFARMCLWSGRPKGKNRNLRWFANSQRELTDKWYTSTVPEPFASYTESDYFEASRKAVEEVWDNDILLWLWREGDAIDNGESPWKWDVDGKKLANRLLYTSADSPRYVGTKDTWRDKNWQRSLKVHAIGYRVGPVYMVLAWAPFGEMRNVTVDVPGYGQVVFDVVDQDGEWRSNSIAIH